MSNIQIIPYTPEHRSAVLGLTIAAWSPIFAKTRQEVPSFVYDAFYPNGWQARQIEDVGALLDQSEVSFWLLVDGQDLLGFLGFQLHPEDQMGAINIIAITPDRQGQGLGRHLMQFAEAQASDAGMSMVMVETVGDSGHAPARAAYEASGYQRWPVARYFKNLQ
ncbi:GNAT family N-acetyltransferase [Chachezhania antarctica]|uniref:GNAT family N-acetyltransferase n=1 Tax=Chachezhania antarctica TaxID=2340860 RepID=UPI000EABB948|nr:GNAT family N-acetyltransferase [Chachezhania antarctica]|tara:strand:+ start:1931 stop:2422 length:492 start_codon:yes stop_codon:yes gene_type:complete